MKRKTELSKKVLLSVLAAGVMSTCVMGSALAEQVIDPTNLQKEFKNFNDQRVEDNYNVSNVDVVFNKPSNYGYLLGPNLYIYISDKNASLTFNNAIFENNKASIAGSALQGLWGGAVFSKGVVNFIDNSFKNNVIIVDNERSLGAGGAILADAAINTGINNGGQPNFVITKDMTYSGNNVISSHGDIWYNTWGAVAQSSGGFLFLDRDSVAGFDIAKGVTLTIGEKGASGNMDSIASSIAFDNNKSIAVINKNGEGTLQINSDFNKYYGSVNVNAGILNLDQNWTARNTINIAEDAKFNAKDITLTKLLDGLDFTKTYGTEIKTQDENNYLYRLDSSVDYTEKVKNGGKTNNSTIVGSIKTAAGSTLTAKNITVNAGSIEAAGNVTADSLVVNDGAVKFNGNSDTEYSIANKLTAKADQITLSGGTLKADNLKALTADSAEKGIKLTDNGVISTMSNQVFANAASANEKETDGISINTIDFQGGTLSLNDAEYTLAYAKDAGSKVGTTKVVMTGKLADAVNDTIKVDEAAVIGDNVALDKVTAEADGSLLVGSENIRIIEGTNVEGIEIKDKVQNGFAVGALNLAADSKGLVITNDKEVTLGGSQGGNLITVGGADKEVKVVVGTTQDITGVTFKAGNLNIGNTLATADTKYKLNGDVVINQDSNLNVNGTTEITKSLTLNDGTVAVNNGSLATDKLDITHGGSGISNLSGTVNANELSVAANTTLAIGDNEDAGKLTVEKAALNGGMLFLDPAFKDGSTIGDASGVAVTNASALDGAYVAGRNSKLSFGADLKAAEAVFAKTGETWGEKGVTAAAYIAKSVALDSTKGFLTVDGSKTVAPTVVAGKVDFAANSLLMVDGAAITSTPAITGVTDASVDSTSKLYIDNAKKGETYKILDGKNTAWSDKNIISSNSLLKFAGDTSNASQFNVTASVQSVKDAFGGEVIAPKAYDAALNATGANAASDFIMNAADSKVNATKAAQVSALNSAAAMSELAGVSHGTYAASNLLTDAVADHMSLANEKEHDSDIWAKYIHTKEDVDGLSIASFGADYDAQYNGIVVGADLYKNGKATVGAALTYVDGNINGNTLAARTKNDATYYGASIYGGIASDDSAVIGDISYLHGKNDITQYNSGATLTADAKSDAFSIGVRAEKSVKAGVGKFVPYAGIRYMHLGTGNYTNSIGMSYDADDMNLWLLPVGVKYSADVKTGAWTIRPLAEVGYVWNMGDRESTQTVSLNGASDGFGYDVTDSGSYIGRFMIEAEKANVTYGLGYEYQKGDSVKANRWMANLNWKF